MSSLCGIVDFEKRSVDFGTLREMGRSMVLRGQDQSGAYLTGGVGLYHNRMLCGEPESERQPYTIVRGGHSYTVMTDGVLQNSLYANGCFALLDFSSAAEAILEAYLSFGLDFAPYVIGSFAFAICDEYRGEVILGRSADGKCPLYYARDERGRLCFASEVKGMARALGGALTVDGNALRRHLLAPLGNPDVCALYPLLYEVEAGTCTVFSRIDAQGFPLPYDDGASMDIGELLIPSAAEALALDACLDEALLAFDHPQFDADMPIYLGALRRAKEKNMRTVRIMDSARCENASYALRREDRLGGLYGLTVYGVTPPDDRRSAKAGRALERALSERLATCDTRVLRHLYGDDVLDTVKREKKQGERIRMMGMLCQSEAWLSRYALTVTHPSAV